MQNPGLCFPCLEQLDMAWVMCVLPEGDASTCFQRSLLYCFFPDALDCGVGEALKRGKWRACNCLCKTHGSFSSFQMSP